MLKYSGHPLIDVGVATIVAFSNKDSPDQITQNDLEAMAKYMIENYTINPLRSYLTVAFPNSGFTQPAYFQQLEKQQKYAENVLFAFRSDAPSLDQKDIFLGLPVTAIPLDVEGKISPGRAYRQHIPLLTGEDIINFHPYGEAGIMVSGLALFSIQALPLGCAKCGGKLLAVHSDNDEIMLYFSKKFLEFNRRKISLAQQAGESKMKEPHLKHRSLLIEYLLDAIKIQKATINDEEPFSITAYHLSNAGQGASLEIYHLPSQFILYLREMLSASNLKNWQKIVQHAWELPQKKRTQKETISEFTPSRNWLYEDLFQVSGNVAQYAPRFIRTYFLRTALNYARKDETDPRGKYSLQNEASLISWKLVESFLWRILNMQKERIEYMRSMGDALANYVKEQNDRRFFRDFYVENRYSNLRNALIKANTDHTRRGNEPFLTFDIFLAVFEDGEELARVDWRLARDLVLIRMVEQLYNNGWLGNNPEAIPESVEPTEEENI